MAAKARKSSKKTTAATTAAEAPAQTQEVEPPQVNFVSRVFIIVVTSYAAEKIWRNRTILSNSWYSENQSSMEQSMISVFEYIVAMGLMFFVGILVSSTTLFVQKLVGL
ncbi:hypothetical protein Poli38472_008938 [Pythium oligandrum]|uniref:Uncharacterized protein n=1 Tax=Pythium oligandrum TaxID=41045 RepID=A0A8K1C4I4_PYTOL|nr:hypothetical protein Poli38472_008938 [Pythium oligandrum]|eukprot:TMW56290.1 hypothetical protein Poli38472_008938 [Pythium oligandrum]